MEKFFKIISYYSFWFMSCEELWTRGPRYHVTTSYLLDWKPIEERNPGRDFEKPNPSINFDKNGFYNIAYLWSYSKDAVKKISHWYPNLNQLTLLL